MKPNNNILIIVSIGCTLVGLILAIKGMLRIAGIIWAVACILSGVFYSSLKKKK